MIEVLTKTGCHGCEQLKAALAAQGVEFVERNADEFEGRAAVEWFEVEVFPAVAVDGVLLSDAEVAAMANPPKREIDREKLERLIDLIRKA